MRSCRAFRRLADQGKPTSKARGVVLGTVRKMDINSKYKMLSGYAIPVLDYEVRMSTF